MNSKTNILALIASLAVSTSVFAEENSFIGFGLGGGSIQFDIEAEGEDVRISEEESEGTGAVTLKFGTDQPSTRSYLIFKALPYEDANVRMLGFSQDWKYHDGPWRPYLGITAGLAMLEWQENPEVPNQFTAGLEGQTARNFAIGVQGGFLYEASDTLNFDISLRALGTSLETSIEIQDSGSTVGVLTQEVNAISSFTLGANFLF